MTRFPWIRRRKRTDPELPVEPPLWLGNHSNGEYFHFQTPYERRLRELILREADGNARRVGIERREFLASAMGMATTLWCINLASCSGGDKSPGANGAGGARGGAGGAGARDAAAGDAGRYCVPEEAMFDEDVACNVLGGNEFIFDIQTHHFDPEGEWVQKNPAYVAFVRDPARVSPERYVELLFCDSDTTMAALSTWPAALCTPDRQVACGLPLPNPSVAASRDAINAAASNTERILNHCQIMPNDPGGLQNQLDIMEQILCDYRVGAWKVYPAWGPEMNGYYMDDEIGTQVIEHGLALGVPIFCIHKGLPIPGFDVVHNRPRDIGVVAKRYSEAHFIVYHSAICAGSSSCSTVPVEGPFDPDRPADELTGSDQLIRSVLDNGIGPNENVYGELGSAYSRVANDATAAAHFIGKLMKYLGEDNVCWGTDAILGGSPQPLIESFRRLEIPESMQDQYGYPALTADRKAKILGLNSARIYGVDPDRKRCEIDACETAMLKRELDTELGPRRWALREPMGLTTWEEYVEHAREHIRKGVPA